MRYLLPIIVLSFLLSCREEKFEEATFCRQYFTANSVIQPLVRAVYPSYKMARFSHEEELTVVFVKQTARKTEVIKHEVESGKSKVLFKRKDPISTFDYSVSGDIAFTSGWDLFVVSKNEEEEMMVPLPYDIGMAKWVGESGQLICQTAPQQLVLLDENYQELRSWSFPFRIIDWWADDSTLIIADIDHMVGYSLPDGVQLWDYNIDPFYQTEDLGTAIFMSSNGVSLSAGYGLDEKVNRIYLSTPTHIYAFDFEDGQIKPNETYFEFWERYDCYVTEPGLDVSFKSDFSIHVLSTISEVHSIDRKQLGVVIMNSYGEQERILMH
ncbi:MAG: hypothetical protein AAFP89_09830 [Bacteroidota bacterium]